MAPTHLTPNPEHRRLSETEEGRDDATVGLQWVADDGTILRANEAALALLGYDSRSYIGRRLTDFDLDEDVVSGLLSRLRAGRSVRNLEVRLRHRNGTVRYVQMSANAVTAMGKFIHARIVTRDISDRKQAEFALRQFKEMVDSADDAISGQTLEGIITYWNRAAERIYGYTEQEMVGNSVATLVPNDRISELSELLAKVRSGERVEHYETRRRRKDGSELDILLSLTPILDANQRPVAASSIARDITERNRIEQELRHGAFHDSLTGLPNRVYFNERVAQALDRLRRDSSYFCAVIFLDFDGFKLINDSLGHQAGDELLILISRRLVECVRPADTVARLGGDEFTILIDEVLTPADIVRATKRLKDALSKPYTIDGKPVVITASIGVAHGESAYQRPEDLLRDADIAMYHSKARGQAGATTTFDLEMRRAAHTRFGVTTDLRAALERGQLRLMYQPIVQLTSGRVHSFEALLRWDHPTRGEVMPTEFIPIAEKTGLIVPIGVWALTEACKQADRWQKFATRENPIHISVNLSATQIIREQIVDEVREALRVSSLDPRNLQLEITESVLLENGELSTARLEALRRLNVELHVDDFGTGYSWLSYLPRFPLQAIKIDRSFVHRMGARRTDLAIVRSIIELASTLGLGVIAEGVETVVQRKNLLRFGCGLGQGFLFAKAVSVKEATGMLT